MNTQDYASLTPQQSAHLHESDYPNFRRLKRKSLLQGEDEHKNSTAEKLNRKRHARNQIRRHVKYYRAINGENPPLQQHERSSLHLADLATLATDRYIILPPLQPEDQSTIVAAPAPADITPTPPSNLQPARLPDTGTLRAFFHETLTENEHPVFQNPPKSKDKLEKFLRLSHLNRYIKTNSREIRMIELQHLRAYIAPNIDAALVTRLRKAGARVYRDRLVNTFVDCTTQPEKDSLDQPPNNTHPKTHVATKATEIDDARNTEGGRHDRSKVNSPHSLGPKDAWHVAELGLSNRLRYRADAEQQWIGLIDTGCDFSHPELRKTKYKHTNISSVAQIDIPHGRKGKSSDPYGHGTAVASLMVGQEIGVAPGVNLAVAALQANMDHPEPRVFASDILSAFNWFESLQNAGYPLMIVNASIGDADFWAMFGELADRMSVYWEDASFFICAAIGNNGSGRSDSPGNFRLVEGVGACWKNDWRWMGSGSGTLPPKPPSDIHPPPRQEYLNTYEKPDLISFGVRVVAAGPKDSYVERTGTSFASPLVAASCLHIIALRQSVAGDCDGLRRKLHELCRPPRGQQTVPPEYGAGILDLSGLDEDADRAQLQHL